MCYAVDEIDRRQHDELVGFFYGLSTGELGSQLSP